MEEGYNAALNALPEAARQYLRYMWDTMPLSDRDNYPPSLLASFAQHAHMLRSTMPWCKALEEQVFLDYVLYHRVNDEDISFNREIFYSELAPRIEGLSLTEAVLEVNRWCHETATYQQQDDRTASPLTVYRNGSGRCGEESAFAVSALRSVGIPARQVYAPRWSHCDDNHAWVEALCEDGAWHFFGACEPEPVLDKGWFNAAASRALLVHSRRFGTPGAPVDAALNGEQLDTKGAAVQYNQTSRYAETRRYTFRVLFEGAPLQGVHISAEVLNGAQLVPILEMRTNEEGVAEAELGKGDIYLRASHPKGCAEQVCRGAAGEDGCTIELVNGFVPTLEWRELDFAAAEDAPVNPGTLTALQKEERILGVALGNQQRLARMEGFWDAERAARLGEGVRDLLEEARGNFGEIAAFLEQDVNPLREQLLRALALKDLRDSTADMLEDHLRGAEGYVAHYPDAVYYAHLLNPRIATERLTPWRSMLAGAYSDEQRAAWRKKPVKLWRHLCEAKTVPEGQSYPNLYWTPDAAYATGRWDEKSRAVLFVALLRSWGIPARLGAAGEGPEFWQDGGFVPAVPQATAVLTLVNQPGQLLTYRQNWSLARREGGNWMPVELGEPEWGEEQLCLTLPVGEYRLVTSVRLPNGNQFAAMRDISLWQDTSATVLLRSYQVQDLLSCHQLPAFSAQNAAGESLENPWLGGGVCTLLLWLAPGEEPTEHVLNELMEAKELLESVEVELVALLREEQAARQQTMAAAIDAFPKMHLLYGDWDYNIELLARRLYRDPDSPPLVVCCNPTGNAVYACSGYNVGLVEFLVQTIRLL